MLRQSAVTSTELVLLNTQTSTYAVPPKSSSSAMRSNGSRRRRQRVISNGGGQALRSLKTGSCADGSWRQLSVTGARMNSPLQPTAVGRG
jgi:hypothetical protein